MMTKPTPDGIKNWQTAITRYKESRMAQDTLHLEEKSFEKAMTLLSDLSASFNTSYDDLVKTITGLSTEWNDEDFHAFLEAIQNMGSKLNDAEDNAQHCISKIKNRLEMIRARTNIKL